MFIVNFTVIITVVKYIPQFLFLVNEIFVRHSIVTLQFTVGRSSYQLDNLSRDIGDVTGDMYYL